jgi:hypothetical protein
VITLQSGKENAWFPTLACYRIPLVNNSISSLLWNIVKLNEVSEIRYLLAFQSHNGTFCSLVQVLSSSNFDNFKRNT